jgi:hypothetical protein
VPSTQKIIQDCHKIKTVAEEIRVQTDISDVWDLAVLIRELAARVEGLAEELQSVSRQAQSAFGTVAAHLEEDHPDSQVL